MGVKLGYVSTYNRMFRGSKTIIYFQMHVYSDKEISSVDPWNKSLLWLWEPIHSSDYPVTYCIVPCKHPSLCTYPLFYFDRYVVFKVPHLTAHHAKFLHSELKVGPLTQCNCLIHFRCHNILQLSFIHTNLLPCSQHSSLAAQHLHTASNEHWGSSATSL